MNFNFTKNIISIFALSFFLILAIGSDEEGGGSSVDPDAPIEEKLEGEWISDQASWTDKLSLNKDGTGYEQSYYNAEWKEQEPITWVHGTAKYSNKDEEYEYIKVTNPESIVKELTFIINYSSFTDGEIYTLERRAGSKITGTYKRKKD